jgi:hypothetical protein
MPTVGITSPIDAAKNQVPVAAGPSERDADFDEAVDTDGPIEIRGQLFVRSNVLASDSAAYREALEEYREQQLAELIETATEQFPHPVAHCFFRYLNSAQSDNQRLQFLKDAWEALIAVIFAVAAGEVRYREKVITVVTQKTRGVRGYIESRNIRDRLEVLRVTENQARSSLPIVSALADSVMVERMIELNKLRNEDFAHLATLNEGQSRALTREIEPDVLAILRKAEGLAGIELIRYLGPTDKRGHHRLEVFTGHNSTRRIEVRELSPSVVAALSQRTQSEVLLLRGDEVFSLSPLIVWREGRGHRSELAFMKKKRVEGTRCVFTFEIFGDAEEFESDAHELLQDLNAIKTLYDTAEEQRA